MTDYAAIREWYKDLGKVPTSKKPASKKPAQPRQVIDQRAASLRRDAQARRAQAEQAARAAEQRRRAEIQRRKVAEQARAAELNRRAREQERRTARKKRADWRVQRHVVTKTDTPASIATQYGITEKAVGDAAGARLRAGQSIDLFPDFGTRDTSEWLDGLRPEKSLFPNFGVRDAAPSGWQGMPSRAERIANFASIQEEEIRRQGAGAINPPLEVAAGVPEGFFERLEGDPDFPDYGAKEPYVDTQRALDRAILGRLQDQYKTKAEEDFKYQVRHEGAKGKYRQAREAWMTGNDALRPDYFTDWELSLYSETVQERIINELGYYRDDEGKWVPMEILDEDYGMGGYEFPGYGVGGGGGFDFKDPTGRGSSYRGYKTGGRTRRESKQMFAGSIPRSHWRV